MKYYIYVLIDPRDGRERYVGQTFRGPITRLKEHCSLQRENNHRAYWLNQLRSLGLKPIMQVIEECDENSYEEKEEYHIRWRRERGYDLVNETEGGEGTKGAKHIRTEEYCLKMSKALTGKKKSPEQVQRMREVASGENNAWFGKKRPDHSKRMKGEANPVAGEKHPQSKLTKQDVLDIKHLLDIGERGRDIANRYNVTESVISRIKHGTRWGWLD